MNNMQVAEAVRTKTKPGPDRPDIGAGPAEGWARIKRFLSPAVQTRMALRVQVMPRLIVFLIWALVLALGVVGFIPLSSGFTGLFTEMVFMATALACSLATFRPLISNAVTRSTIAWTQIISNVVMALATATFMIGIAIISNLGQIGWMPFTESYQRFLVQGCSPWRLTLDPWSVSCFNRSYDQQPSRWLALALHVFMVQVAVVLLGQVLGDLAARLDRKGGCLLLAGLLICVGLWYSISGWNFWGWPQTAVRMLNLTRGHWMYKTLSPFMNSDLWGYFTVYLLWPQVVFTLVFSAICIMFSYWLTSRRQLPAIQGLGILG
ncbi:hypothetical protein H3S93_00835 [Bifidobacterium sp. W8109]|uniref:hypothetical protein n=1 Tax=Bifidobacterium TaxID=1678 RepID=UPI0018DE0300|nr:MULTISPECIES: hypothetical protein [Bifidobacterium]MBH9970871.1 hypothetical protein [Bifidobacterium asteroides]MBI0072806.1 hypothetical protein [Bifidobacterium sp. W8110]